ncbi:uncharacterized protein (TIGR04255 family) [Nocardioides sp. SLBN-35]|nr:uncharacterized protein (TIGR04255 family) [Nocardioides sp. SLBN-35]
MQSVALTVYFEPISGLQVSHFSALRESWRNAYPSTSELPPLRPQNRGGEETRLLPVAGAWPFPYLLFSSKDETSSIALQNDRFSRGWVFNSDGDDKYPGFDELSRDLRERLDEVRDVIKAETGETIKPVGSTCTYFNRLPDMSLLETLVGFTSRWQVPVGEAESPKTTYAGARLHLCDDDDLDGCSVTMSVDVDDDGTYMSIESSYDLGDEQVDDLGGLDRAHDMLIAKFIEYTSGTMHEQWGRTE